MIWTVPFAALLAVSTILAQTAPASHDATLARQLEEARQQLAEQAALLHQMRAELTRQAAAIDQLRTQQTALLPASLSGSAEDAPRLQNAVLQMRAGLPAGQPVIAALRAPQESKPVTDKPADLFIRIGSAKLTPGGYVDMTAIFRSTNVGSGLSTTLQGIPFNNTTQGGLSEVRLTAQGTRLSLRLDEVAGKTQIFGYVETDFNGYLAGNGSVSTNSNTLRLRAAYVNLAHGKWEMLGGQQWSLLTPTRKTMSPFISDLFVPPFLDSSYQAGLTYTRQNMVRLVYHPSPFVAAAVALENPQQFSGSAVSFPALFSNTEVDINSSTGSGGAMATPNLHPDVIARLTFDHPVAGLAWHGSIAGLLTSSRLETPASITKTVAVKDNREGGAIAGNINLELARGFRLLSTGYWSDGGGRYMGGIGPGLVVLQNGATTAPFTAALIHSGSGIGGFEWAATKNTTLTALGSAVYFQRRYGIDPSVKTTTYVGYGFPGSPNTNNRIVREYSVASTTTLWKSPSYGALQLVSQTSYVWRAPWYVAAGAPRDAHTLMEFMDLRYIIP
jgi:hypothetical protein